MRKSNIIIMINVFLCAHLYAQEKLTLKEAIQITLEKNYDIAIAHNGEQMAANNATTGNAGMLPSITLSAARSLQNNNTLQEFSNGNTLDKKGAGNNLAAGVALEWTLFDGTKMFATYNKLKELHAMGTHQARLQIENTVEQVIGVYYSIVEQKQLLAATDTTILIYDERVKIATEKFSIGSGTRADVLQAKLDANEQQSIRLKQHAALTMAKMKLNQLLARKADTDFDVDSYIEVNTTLQATDTYNAAMSSNQSLLYYKRDVAVSQFALREQRANRLPLLGLNAAYNFSRTQNQAGFFLLNQNLGLSAGITASWNLFHGMATSRQIKDKQFALLNAQLNLRNIQSQIETQIYSAFENYKLALQALTLENENTTMAKEYAEIMLARFRLGSATSLEIRTAQKTYNDALSRLVQARYDAKIAETSLLKLKGELVKLPEQKN